MSGICGASTFFRMTFWTMAFSRKTLSDDMQQDGIHKNVTLQNDIQHNGIQHNDTVKNDIKRDGIQQNDTLKQ
jgi:hypothetical protein